MLDIEPMEVLREGSTMSLLASRYFKKSFWALLENRQ